ncbi:MAG: O-antigen ligase family protein [Patescibacteria group bacterium]
METLIAFYAIFFLILAVRHLDLAIMLIIIALPSYLIRFNIFNLPITLLELMIWLAFFVWASANWRLINANLRELFKKHSQKIKNKYPFDFEIILLLIISFIAVGVAGFSAGTFGVWKAYFFEPILFFILIINIFQRETDRKKILWPLAISALLVSLVAIFQKITGAFIFNEFWATTNTRRVVSFFGYPNAIGLFLGPIILILVGWLVQTIVNYKLQAEQIFNLKKIKLFFIINIVIILSVLSIYFAKSKGAILGVVAGLVVFGLLAGKKARAVVLLLIIIFSLAVCFCQPCKKSVIENITLNNLSGQIRQQQWRETWQMLKNGRIIFGAGLANYQKTVQPYHQAGIFFNNNNDPDFHRKTVFNVNFRRTHWQPTEIYLYPHNIILNFWSELGLAGLLLFIWIIGKYFYISAANCKSQTANCKFLNLGLLGAMIVIVAHGFVDVPYFKNDLAILFWLLVAMTSLVNAYKHPLISVRN